MPAAERSASLTPELQEELEARMLKASKDNRISCSMALALAKSLGISAADVGKTANRLNIRISKCQLGCF